MTPYALDHPAVREYLQRLYAATAHLPADERAEISEGIRSHLIVALAEARTEVDVRTTLDALGDPEEIVGAAPPPPGSVRPPLPTPQRASARGGLEIAAVILLLVGAFVVPVIGWVVGVVLLWVSRAWTVPEKVLGTLVVPGGLAAFVVLALLPLGMQTCGVEIIGASGRTVTTCSGGIPPWVTIPLTAFMVIGPIVTAVYLLRAAGRRPATG